MCKNAVGSRTIFGTTLEHFKASAKQGTRKLKHGHITRLIGLLDPLPLYYILLIDM